MLFLVKLGNSVRCHGTFSEAFALLGGGPWVPRMGVMAVVPVIGHPAGWFGIVYTPSFLRVEV